MTGQRIFTENTYRQTVSKIINLFIGVIVIWTWLSMTFRLGRLGAESPGGFGNLRYFTVLSNLFQGIVSLIYFCGRKISRWKYASTTAIAFTFFIALLFLAPVRGLHSVYSGANFFSHLVVPVLAIVDFLIFDREGTFTLRDSLIAVIPMLAYSLFYVGNILIKRDTGCSRGLSGSDSSKLDHCSCSQAAQKANGAVINIRKHLYQPGRQRPNL